MKEGQPKSSLEGVGHAVRIGGIIAGIIGLISNPILLGGGILATAGGEYLRRQGKKKNG